MAIWNVHPYSLNEGTAYPVDEAATLRADDGTPLPSNLIVDLQLRWPGTPGGRAFLASATVTDRLVSVTFQAEDPSGGFVPLAVCTQPQPVQRGRHYALLGQAEGVGGWIVFGTGVTEPGVRALRFATAAQAFLAPRAARAYPAFPVRSLGKRGADIPLDGVVRLRATPPLAATREAREVDGVLRDCVVVRLADDARAFPVPDAAAALGGYRAPSPFLSYAGPCAGRPESRTCGAPEPIEFVAAVGPDCAGVLTIEFAGCAALGLLEGGHGVVVDCTQGLAVACLPPRLPGPDGTLPGTYPPAPPPAPTPTPPPEAGGDSLSGPFPPSLALPLAHCVTAGDAGAAAFAAAAGAWEVVAEPGDAWLPCPAGSDSLSDSLSASLSLAAVTGRGGSAFVPRAAAGRNVLLWDPGDAGTLGRRFSAHLRLLAGPAGARRNAALVLNYPAAGDESAPHVIAELDYDAQQLRLARFTGTTYRTIAAQLVPAVRLDRWYRLAASVLPAAGGVALAAQLWDLEDPATRVEIGPIAVAAADYAPGTGRFGVGTNRALAAFTLVELEET